MLGLQVYQGFLKHVPSVLSSMICVVWESRFLHHYCQRKLTSQNLKKPNEKWG